LFYIYGKNGRFFSCRFIRVNLQEFQHCGDLYGGANQAVLEMLEEIHQNGGDADKYMAKAKDKDDPFRWVLAIEYIKL
jgi:hypothetical protein